MNHNRVGAVDEPPPGDIPILPIWSVRVGIGYRPSLGVLQALTVSSITHSLLGSLSSYIRLPDIV